jgi:hypothetical protein
MDDSRAVPGSLPARKLPPYLLVLLAAGLAGIGLMSRAAGVWEDAAQAQSFPPEIRRQLAFAVLFNGGLLVALLMALVGELAGAAFRLLRKGSGAVSASRVGVALLVLAVFGAGHALLNPWVSELARAAWGALGP